MAKNVIGTDLEDCSCDPMTGFFRDGKCNTCGDDHGMHTVCAVMTDEFLEFSRSRGNAGFEFTVRTAGFVVVRQRPGSARRPVDPANTAESIAATLAPGRTTPMSPPREAVA